MYLYTMAIISISVYVLNIISNESTCSDKCNCRRESTYSFKRINYSLLVFRNYNEEPLFHHLQG